VTRAIENAQRKVEARNFDMRKQILEYDDVANEQRKVIYEQRSELLESDDISETIAAMRDGVLQSAIDIHLPPESMEEQWDVAALEKTLSADFLLDLPIASWLANEKQLDLHGLAARISESATQVYQAKVDLVGAEAMHEYESAMVLQSLDRHWREHLSALDHLRQGIHLRGYAQKNPKQEYKREAFELFASMLDSIKREVVQILMSVQIRSEEDVADVEMVHAPENVQYHHADYEEALAQDPAEEQPEAPMVRNQPKVGRNEPCPCGSGKKYKQCHGKLS
jgi:preprotein translocase subunit SecA